MKSQLYGIAGQVSEITSFESSCGVARVAALGTKLRGINCVVRLDQLLANRRQKILGNFMRRLVSPSFSRAFQFAASAAAICAVAVILGTGAVQAQSGDLRPQEQTKQGAANAQQDQAKDNQRKVDEFAEAAQAINGPAGNPECVWLGRRVVGLMWRDDLDTAFRHLDLYDRFGCPGGHVQAAFRCLTRFGAFDPKAPETLTGRVHACWINPAAQPAAAATAATPAPAQPATPAPAAPAPAAPPAATK
jgi:hypothetical protein